LDEKDVIQTFLDHRNEILGTKYRVLTKPDAVNRSAKAVDAVCESEGVRPLAIEHTRLQTFERQIRDNRWFTRSVEPLESALAHRYDPWWLGITFDYARDKHWGDATGLIATIRDWLDANIERIPVQKTGREMFEGEIPGVGMVRISKHKDSRRPGIYVSRTIPPNVEFAREGIEIMTDTLGHKYNELAAYRTDGYISVLLIDTRDIALTSHIAQYKAFLRSTKADPMGGLEEIWVADILEGREAKDSVIDFLCFRGPKEIRDKANPENFMLGPEHDNYWDGVIANDEQEGGKQTKPAALP
jgi:hypothetical protein